MRLLFLDTETGSLNPETGALLSIGLVDYVDGRISRTEEILVDADGLECQPQALAVNGIDLDIHHGYSVSRSEAARRIREFAKPMERPWVCGHNVYFDIGFLKRLFAHGSWSFTFGHRTVDTLNVLAYLAHAGLIPESIAKLEQATAHFGIAVELGKRHTALADAIAAAQVYTAALDLIRRKVA